MEEREEEGGAASRSPPLQGAGAEVLEAVDIKAEGEEEGSEGDEGEIDDEEDHKEVVAEPEAEPEVDEFWAEAEVPGPNPETVAFRAAARKAADILIRGRFGHSNPCQPELVGPEPAKKLVALISGGSRAPGGCILRPLMFLLPTSGKQASSMRSIQ